MVKQKGVAVLTVLLVVAISTVMAISMVSRQQIDIRRTENILRLEQAWSYVQGIDAWAAGRLLIDRDTNKIDSVADNWNNPITETAVTGGELSADIVDLQGRYNLNNLIGDDIAIQEDLARFKRLLVSLNQSPDLANALLDWLDENSEFRFPNGAEDSVYLQREPAFRTGNTAMAHPSELLLVEGFDETVYAVLKPYIMTLPEKADININTASVPVLMSLSEGITTIDAEMIVESRTNAPFTELDQFLQHPALAGRTLQAQGLSINSQYFQVHGKVHVGQLTLQHASIIKRPDAGAAQVIQRLRKDIFDE